MWIELGRDRTHQRFEDFERASEGRGRRGSAEGRGSRHHDDVAGNLDAIANFLSELTNVESRLPHLNMRLAEAAEKLLEGQDDLDDMVRSIDAAKGMIEGLVNGSAWGTTGVGKRVMGDLAVGGAQTDAPTTPLHTMRVVQNGESGATLGAVTLAADGGSIGIDFV